MSFQTGDCLWALFQNKNLSANCFSPNFPWRKYVSSYLFSLIFTLKWLVAFAICALCLSVFSLTLCHLRQNWAQSFEILFRLITLIEISLCILLSFDCIKLPPKIPADLYMYLMLETCVNISYVSALLLYYFMLPVFMPPTIEGLEKFPTVMDRTEIFSRVVNK